LGKIFSLKSVDVLGVKRHERVVYVFPYVYFISLLIKWFSGVFSNGCCVFGKGVKWYGGCEVQMFNQGKFLGWFDSK